MTLLDDVCSGIYNPTFRQCAALKGKDISEEQILTYGTLKGRWTEISQEIENETKPADVVVPELQLPKEEVKAIDVEQPAAVAPQTPSPEEDPKVKGKEAIDATVNARVTYSVYFFVQDKNWQTNSKALQRIGAYAVQPTPNRRRLWRFSCAQDTDHDTSIVRYKRGDKEGMRLSNAPFQLIHGDPKYYFV